MVTKYVAGALAFILLWAGFVAYGAAARLDEIDQSDAHQLAKSCDLNYDGWFDEVDVMYMAACVGLEHPAPGTDLNEDGICDAYDVGIWYSRASTLLQKDYSPEYGTW